MFGHTFELIIVLLLGLLIFGPKRVIEMGAAAGKMLRELRDAMKDMNWSALSGDEHGSDPLAELRDLPRTFASSILNPPPVTAEPPVAPTPPVTAPAAPASPAEPPAAAASPAEPDAPPAGAIPDAPASPAPTVEAESATRQAQNSGAPAER